ncbi:DUF3311 domain-containing protein [Sinosporangium siamense]|uniref:DUF3311 domain-containing protein n=1 Tax=Sinosporangium siamense TaxID=1367973 RepID=A0A919RLZ4_9ACTN|nr:DUF3311 domain-containing protein [Sinosporangium siamense]GII94419.1 hypothetical protein Ssi02_46500 [Sinosporangium siamense]
MAKPARHIASGICLAVPVAALLWVPWYPHEAPHLAGIPFFFWYQLAWVPGSMVFMAAAYLLRRGADRSSDHPPRDRRRRP